MSDYVAGMYDDGDSVYASPTCIQAGIWPSMPILLLSIVSCACLLRCDCMYVLCAMIYSVYDCYTTVLPVMCNPYALLHTCACVIPLGQSSNRFVNAFCALYSAHFLQRNAHKWVYGRSRPTYYRLHSSSCDILCISPVYTL